MALSFRTEGFPRLPGAALALALAFAVPLAACGHAGSTGRASLVGGRVTLASGEPLAEARVCLHRTMEPVAETVTDEAGRFEVHVGSDAPVCVKISKAVEVRTEDGAWDWEVLSAEADDVAPGAGELALVARREAQDRVVRVRVLTDEGALPYARVRTSPPVLPPDAYRWLPQWPQDADGEGQTVQERLTRSPVSVRVWRRAPWCGACLPCVLPQVLEDAGTLTIRLVRERLLRGRVVDEAGLPVACVGVMPISDDAGSACGWGDLTGLQGEFVVGVPETWTEVSLLVGGAGPHHPEGAHRAATVRLGTETEIEDIVLRVPDRGVEAARGARRDAEASRVVEAVFVLERRAGAWQVVHKQMSWIA